MTYLDVSLALGGTPNSYSDESFFVDATHLNKRGYCTVYTAPAVQQALGCQKATYTDCSPGTTVGARPSPLAPAACADDDASTLAQFVDALAAMPLAFQPGTRWNYSYATDVCGRLVEVIAGMPLGRFLRERIFAPLRMADTAFSIAASE